MIYPKQRTHAPEEMTELNRIKEMVAKSYQYFHNNYQRFNDNRRFLFVTSLSDADQGLNKQLNRPNVEFNVIESYVSRMCGEFSKNMPAFSVSARHGKKADYNLLRFLEDHIRDILHESNKHGFEYQIYRDSLSGGFSSAYIYTDYESEMSFDQCIRVKRCYDPCLVGFDMMAMNPDKSDSDYCFYLTPMREENFKRDFPDVQIGNLTYARTFESFSWSYKNDDYDKIIIVCDFFEKKKYRKKILRLTNGESMTVSDYKKYLKDWESSGRIEQPAQVIGKPRVTTLCKIVRTRMIESQIISEEETDYGSLPLKFCDGNSILLKDESNNGIAQLCRPVFYQAIGAQKAKNYAGQSVINWLENMPLSKFMIPKDGIPDGYEMPWKQPQIANCLVYNAFYQNDPDKPLPRPEAIVPPPMPQEIMQTFTICDTTIQAALGAFDASLAKLTERDVSGIAIQESITLSNASTMPYVTNFMVFIQSVVEGILELIPKIYTTPRTVPVMTREGKRMYVEINTEGGVQIDFDKDALQIRVDPAPSFAAQKAKSLNEITQMSHAIPIFGQFINDKCLPIVLDNMQIKDIELLKEKADEWMKEMEQAKKAAAQNQKQDPTAMLIQVEAQKNAERAQLEQAKLQLDMKKLEAEYQLELLRMEIDKQKLEVDKQKIQTELTKVLGELQLKQSTNDNQMLVKSTELAMENAERLDRQKIELQPEQILL